MTEDEDDYDLSSSPMNTDIDTDIDTDTNAKADSNTNINTTNEPIRTSLLMELTDRVGVLHDVLRFFWKYDINVTRIESRPAHTQTGTVGKSESSSFSKFDFFVDLEGQTGDDGVDKLLNDLKNFDGLDKLLILDKKEGECERIYEFLVNVWMHSMDAWTLTLRKRDNDGVKKMIFVLMNILLTFSSCCLFSSFYINKRKSKVQWFPRHVSELDRIANRTLDAGTDLESNHPGFNDPIYRSRRGELAKLSQRHKWNKPIATIQYSEEEIATWSTVWDKMEPLIDQYACKEYLEAMDLMKEHCGYSRETIPQQNDISAFLQSQTNFSMRPVSGLLSSRDFLNGLAFR